MNADAENPAVQPCFRCGKPSEPLASPPASAWIGSEPESQLPMCPDCSKLLSTDPTEFWKPLQRKLGDR